MPRVNHVKKAAKPQGSCGKCGKKIDKGDAYKWLKKRYGPKVLRCPGCEFRPSDHTGGRLGEVYDAQEDASQAVADWDSDDVSELREVLSEFGQRLEELSDEYQESCDNIREHFSESETADDCEEKADQLREWQSECDNADLDEWEPDLTNVECPECQDSTEEQGSKDGKDMRKCQNEECGHVFEVDEDELTNSAGESFDEWQEAQREKAQEIVDNCPM